MDLQNMDLQGGSLQISTEVIAKIARCAALEVEGVAEVSCGTQNKKLKDLLEASIQPPVAVEMRDGTAELTMKGANDRHDTRRICSWRPVPASLQWRKRCRKMSSRPCRT